MFKNTLAQSSTIFLASFFGLLLAPLLLSRLGLDQFGVWAVTGAVATYAGLVNLGVTRALARFVALYDLRGDRQAIGECLALGLLVTTVLGVLVFGAAVLATPLATRLLGVLSPDEMRIVLLSSAAILVAQEYRGVLAAVPVGMRVMVPPNVAGSFGAVLNFGFSVAALLASRDLTVYALANAAAEVIRIAFGAAAMVYVWRRPTISLPSMARAREVIAYSLRNQVHVLSDIVNNQTDKIIIALLIGVRVAAAYELGARAANAVRALGVLTISALLPTATAEIASQGRSVIARMYSHYTERVVALSFPLLIVTALTAPFLLVAWLGSTPEEGVVVVIAISVAYLARMTTEVGMNIANADGRPGMVAINSGRTAVLNVVFTLALAPLFDLWGVLAGTILALFVGSLLFLRDFHRYYELPVDTYLRAIRSPVILAGGLTLPFLAVYLLFGISASTRPSAVAVLLGVTGLYGLAYWVLASRLRLLPKRIEFPLFKRPEQAVGAP